MLKPGTMITIGHDVVLFKGFELTDFDEVGEAPRGSTFTILEVENVDKHAEEMFVGLRVIYDDGVYVIHVRHENIEILTPD